MLYLKLCFKIIRETVFNECQNTVNASINNDELLNFGKLQDPKYYNM